MWQQMVALCPNGRDVTDRPGCSVRDIGKHIPMGLSIRWGHKSLQSRLSGDPFSCSPQPFELAHLFIHLSIHQHIKQHYFAGCAAGFFSHSGVTRRPFVILTVFSHGRYPALVTGESTDLNAFYYYYCPHNLATHG